MLLEKFTGRYYWSHSCVVAKVQTHDLEDNEFELSSCSLHSFWEEYSLRKRKDYMGHRASLLSSTKMTLALNNPRKLICH